MMKETSSSVRGLLNLERPFEDAIRAMSEAGHFLKVPPLAASVCMMQQDVINHYDLALEHYLTADKSYPKWMEVTNDDFDSLTFVVANLVRYTGRLLIETLKVAYFESGKFEKLKSVSRWYEIAKWIVKPRTGPIGVRCEEDQSVRVVPIGVGCEGNGERHFRIDTKASRTEVLRNLQQEGREELSRMISFHDQFVLICQDYYAENPVVAPYNRYLQSYLM